MSDQNQPPVGKDQPKPPETAPKPRLLGLLERVGGEPSEIIHREAIIPEQFSRKRDRSKG